MRSRSIWLAALLVSSSSFLFACSSSSDSGGTPADDSGAVDDSATTDSTAPPVDSAVADSAVSDTGAADSAVADSAVTDSAPTDTAVADSAVTDTAVTDTADSATIDSTVTDSARDSVADTATDGVTIDTASLDTTDTADAGCFAIVNDATPITNTNVGGATPVGTGGTIVAGTYHVTNRTDYAGGGSTGSHTLKVTLAITPTSANGEWVEDTSDTNFRATLVTTVAGGMAFALTCPGAGVTEWDSYTASTTTLTLFSSSKHKSVVLTLR